MDAAAATLGIVGYADRWSVEPGGAIRFMVSCEASRYRASVVRLLGDAHPETGSVVGTPVASDIEGDYDGRVQRIHPGSYVRVPSDPRLDVGATLEIEAWIFATTPDRSPQALLSRRDAFWLGLADGCVELRIGGEELRLEAPVMPRTWYLVSASYDRATGEARLTLSPADPGRRRETASRVIGQGEPVPGIRDDLTFAAAEGVDGIGDFYNGKIEAPRIRVDGMVAGSWDFAADVPSRRVRDASGRGLDGRAVNMPTRGVTGHSWNGTELSWRHAPEQYGAIHFHDDDLDDAGWEVDVTWSVPAGLPSGAYALRIEADGEADHIPFFVRPRCGQPTARILFLAPVFSYLAYADDHMGSEGSEAAGPRSPSDRYIAENRLNSLYDRHTDGSGVAHASWLRPLVNMRPGALLFGMFPHQLSADLGIVGWLHDQGYTVDVVTDVDLHHDGGALLEDYAVVLTGSHPEYVSGRMLDALEGYLASGGRLMYLGGNGMYWVTELDPEDGHTVEIRRTGPAAATWRAEPGDGALAASGEPGGLWRHRGRAPQRLVGVGTTAQGFDAGRPYVRQAGSHDPRVSFIFEGIAPDAPIGDVPCRVNGWGAAGFEFDRVDADLGTPNETILLATASGFSDGFRGAPEDVLTLLEPISGVDSPLVRCDMVYIEHPGGGAVFSTGSIAWSGCLTVDDDNDVSRITRNVLDRFAEREHEGRERAELS